MRSIQCGFNRLKVQTKTPDAYGKNNSFKKKSEGA